MMYYLVVVCFILFPFALSEDLPVFETHDTSGIRPERIKK